MLEKDSAGQAVGLQVLLSRSSISKNYVTRACLRACPAGQVVGLQVLLSRINIIKDYVTRVDLRGCSIKGSLSAL